MVGHDEAGDARLKGIVHSILDSAVDGIIVIDERGLVQSFNPAAERLFGYAPAEIVGKSVNALMPSPFREEHDGYLQAYLQTGRKKIIGVGREVVGRRKDGTTFPMHLSVGEVKTGDRKAFTGIVHDLSDFKRMQEQVVRNESLAAVGEMAASVAHEIRNPLAAISGAVQVLRDTLDPSDSRREVMGDVLGQIHRLDSTVRQLLMLAKPWKPEKKPCRIREIVERVIQLSRNHPQFAGVSQAVEGHDDPTAPVDPALLEQVLWNLHLNAAQAMAQGGAIRTRLELDEALLRITVSDTGPGLTPEVQGRVFRPFVTTKATGAGLGLSICRKIIEAHGGSILSTGRPGQGAEFTVTLPAR